MESKSEIERIQQAILALETQRQSLGDMVVETALAPLRERLNSLQSGVLGEGRKLITVLFADLVDHTTLFAQLDPEDVRELLNEYFALWRRKIELHGGQVEKYIGDAVMAVFGLPASSEDDPESAIRAALDMRQALEQLNLGTAHTHRIRLEMRVGIHTGEAVVSSLGERLGEEFNVVGETVNLASRLQNAAPAGGVLITHDTYRHVRGIFNVEPVEAFHVKGILEPVHAYLVKDEKPRAFRMGRRGVEGIATRLVGRGEEFKRLQDVFHAVAEDRHLWVATLVGEAGIGKSRLISEFADWLDLLPERVYYFKGRAHPSTKNTPYSLIREVFAFRFQIQDSDPPEVVRHKLEQGYTSAFYTTTPEGGGKGPTLLDHRPAHYLGRLLGFEFGYSEQVKGAELDARGFYGQALVYLTNYFQAMANAYPTVILLEDLHWADDSSLDLVHHLGVALAGQPLQIVSAARSDFFERRPHWGEDFSFHTRVELGPLSKRDSRSLVEQILRNVQDLPEGLCELVVSTAEGNPFYIEELLNMFVEDGVIVPATPYWQVKSERLADIRIPATLVGVLQARFDNLSPDQRTCLQRGSVIGRTFWDQAVEYLGSGKAAEGKAGWLRASQILELFKGREMIYKRDHSTFEETNEYLFKHALLRDVIYESLLKRKRREYHRLAAGWLERVTERVQRSEEFVALIAAHYEQAGEAGLAAEWYWRAGRGAAARYASSEAVHAFSQALALLPPANGRQRFENLLAREKMYELQGAQELRALDLAAMSDLAEGLSDPALSAQVALRQASYEHSLSDFPAAIAAAEKAAKLAKDSKNMKIAAEAFLLQAGALLRQGSFDVSRKYAQRALILARREGYLAVQANSLRNLGLIDYYTGNTKEALDHFESALQLYSEIGDRQGEGMALNNLGGANFDLSNYQEAGAYYARSLQLCREIGDRMGEGRALNNLGIISVVNADYPRAEDYYLHALQISREAGQRSFEASTLDNLGNLANDRYQYSQAQKYQHESLITFRQIGDRVGESFALVNLGRSFLATGDYENARNYLQGGLSLSRELRDHQGESIALVYVSNYYLKTGEIEAAHAHVQQALDLSIEHEQRSEKAMAYHTIGNVRLALGQIDEALEFFGLALEIRRALGESREAIVAQSSLTEVFLKKGDIGAARRMVEVILDHFRSHDHFGLDEPARVILTCYRVLAAGGDAGARAVLEQGYRLLQDCAANIDDESQMRSFLELVPANRDLVEAWNSLQRKA